LKVELGVSMSVTMEILFLLLLLHATLTSAGGPPTNQLDRQSNANGNLEQVLTAPVVEHPESIGIRQSERHFWHWLHKQHRQSELRHKADRGGRSRRWKEVANGEDETSHRVMLEKDDFSQPQLDLENSSSHEEENHVGEHNGIHVASWRWDEIGIYITFTTFIIVAGLAKVGN